MRANASVVVVLVGGITSKEEGEDANYITIQKVGKVDRVEGDSLKN